jgi:hypothetical protein
MMKNGERVSLPSKNYSTGPCDGVTHPNCKRLDSLDQRKWLGNTFALATGVARCRYYLSQKLVSEAGLGTADLCRFGDILVIFA